VGRHDAHDDGPALERGQQLAERLGAGDGVELVSAFGQPRRGGDVVVGAERDDDDVGVIGGAIGHDASGGGADRGDEFLLERDARLGQAAVGEVDGLGRGATEHRVELLVAEDEAVVLVDEGDVHRLAEGFGEAGGDLEPAEPGACDHDSHDTLPRGLAATSRAGRHAGAPAEAPEAVTAS
jgi:hypothetical protein